MMPLLPPSGWVMGCAKPFLDQERVIESSCDHCRPSFLVSLSSSGLSTIS